MSTSHPAVAKDSTTEISPEKLQSFLSQLMAIQKRYAHELRNVRTDRQGEVVELVNKFASKELNAQ